MGATPGIATARARVRSAAADRSLAFRNAFKVSASLLATWGIALAIRLVLPRYLGPAAFGDFSFADAFSATFFVLLTFGVDGYIYRAVSVHPEHASDFFAAVALLRLVLSFALVVPMWLVLEAAGRPPELQRVVWAFSVANALVAVNATLAAILQAESHVDGLAIQNVLSKVVWAGGIGLAIWLRAPLWGFAVPLVASEALKLPALAWLAARHAGLRFRVNLRETGQVLVRSAPFYANGVALVLFAKLEYSVLAGFAAAEEVGYYGAAATIAAVALIATPLIATVVYPLLARARARGEDELDALLRRVLELVFAVALPISLAAALGADLWIRIVFGRAFAPATVALTILAPTLLATYVNTLSAMTLNVLDRSWRVVSITAAGVVLDTVLNVALVPSLIGFMGRPGAGATACALAKLATELSVCGAMLWVVGRRAFDRRSLARLGRSALAAAAAVVAAAVSAPLGPLRIVVAALVYLAVAFATRAVRLDDARALLATARGDLADAAGESRSEISPDPR